MRVLLTFTYGVSLNDWNDRGIFKKISKIPFN